jgi:hypothetical protein
LASNLIIPDGKKVEKLWEWDNSIDQYKAQETVMTPWKGYFIKNNESDTVGISIKPVYYSSALSKNLESQTVLANDLSSGEWEIDIESNNSIPVKIGGKNNSIDEWDINDLSAPPPAPVGTNGRVETNGRSSLLVYIPHPEWIQCSGNYVRDFRPTGEDGYMWDIDIKNKTSEAASYELDFNKIGDFPESYQVVFYDLDKCAEVQAVENTSGKMIYKISFGIDKNTKSYRIMIGTKEYVDIEKQKTEQESLKYALWQNYPNPFNPSTVINYQLPVDGNVSIKIYNTLGQEVKTLVNEYMQKGNYTIEWKPGNIPSGVYFYQIRSGNYSKVMKMLYIR